MLNKKNSWFAAALLSGLLVTACSHELAKQAAPAPVPLVSAINNAVIQKSPNDDRTYAALMLPNQLQVVLVSDPTLENSAASLAVGVGSAEDPNSQPGLAHYLEHMLFLGTKKYPVPDNFFQFVETNAGMTNAFTAFDTTNFLFQINAAKFEDALDRYSDYFKAPLLDPKYADKERHAVDSEWSMDKSQDAWIIHTLDGLTANPANPASRFSIGNLETLVDKKNSDLQDELKAFYNKYYSANNMRLTLVGKQSIPELKALAEKYFSDIPNKNVVRPEVTTPGLTQAELGKVIHYRPQKDLKQLFVDYPLKDSKAQWRLKPNEFVANLLGSEEEGTLCEQLRKEGLATNVAVSLNPDEYGNDGYLRVQVELTDAGLKNSDQVIASVLAYANLVRKQGLNERYFRELQAIHAKDFANVSKQDPLTQAIQITSNQFDYPIENVVNATSVYDHFDPQVVQAALEQLKPENVRIWYVDKNEKVDTDIPHFDGQYSLRDITPEEREKWKQLGSELSFNLPPENNLFTDKQAPIVNNEFLKPHPVVSKKGIEAWLAQPEFYREDKGKLALEVNVDFAHNSPKNTVLSSLLNDIAKNKNVTLIDRADRASLEVALDLSATGSQVFRISGYTTKHEELLQMLLKSFADLNISEADFSDALDKYKRNIANNKKAVPLRQGFAQIQRLLAQDRWKDEALLAAASKLKLNDLVAYHRAVKANHLLRIYAFGNYTEANMKDIAQLAASILPGNKMPQQRTLAKYIQPKPGQKLVVKDEVEQADNAVIMGYWDVKKSDDEHAQLVVLNALFGNAFFNQLRTNEQLGYIVGSTPYPVDERPGYAIYVQSTNTDLAKLKARMDKFRTEFFDVLKNTDPATIDQFKKAEAASVLQKPTDFYKEATRYEADFWAGRYDFTARDRYLAALERVNKDNMMAVYQKLLLEDKGLDILVQLRGKNFAEKPTAH